MILLKYINKLLILFIIYSQTTRLGKYINELRRRTTNESLAKRAKDLVKKWRDLILPEANGQIKTASSISSSNEKINSPTIQDVKNRKRPLKDKTDVNAKKPVINGQRDYEFSDNSNCSVKDLKKTDVIFINSDSNSSMPDQTNDSFNSLKTTTSTINTSNNTPPKETFEEIPPQPKKRGRKKGSKNHKHLIVAAEESFTNKMSAISRNSKVKTTVELLADLQNRSVKPDIELRAAQLTESLSRIDQKLNPQKNINQNVVPIKNEKIKSENKIFNSIKTEFENNDNRYKQENDQGSSRVTTPDVVIVPSDDEIVDVVGTDGVKELEIKEEVPESLTVEEILAQLPPIDRSALKEPDEFPVCTCPVPECENVDNNITVQIINEDQKEPYSIFESSPKPSSPKSEDEEQTISVKKCDSEPIKEIVENLDCPTRHYIRNKYNLDSVSDETVESLKYKCISNVNGNFGIKTDSSKHALSENGLYLNIVPTFESLSNDLNCVPNESFNKYSISIDDDDDKRGVCDSENPPRINDLSEFREWHQTLDVQSYNGESLRILPYVIID